MTLGEGGSEGGGFCGVRNIGSLFHAEFRGALWTGGSGAGRFGLCDGVLKSWVKLPSPEAEPETPGDEKPFARAGLAAGNGACLVSSSLLFGELLACGFTPPTKIRVNSPGARSDACSLATWEAILTAGVAGRIEVSPDTGGAGFPAGRDSRV